MEPRIRAASPNNRSTARGAPAGILRYDQGRVGLVSDISTGQGEIRARRLVVQTDRHQGHHLVHEAQSVLQTPAEQLPIRVGSRKPPRENPDAAPINALRPWLVSATACPDKAMSVALAVISLRCSTTRADPWSTASSNSPSRWCPCTRWQSALHAEISALTACRT